MANFQSKPPTSQAAVAWVEEQVDDWIRSRIRGIAWSPGPIPQHPRLIRKAEVLRRVGLSHVTIWQLERNGRFPARVLLTGGDRRLTVEELGDAA
jgi:predicted DNA-binding transcriptional regulator AlpA